MTPLRFRGWWSGLKKMMTDFRIAADGRVFSAAGNELFIPSDVVLMQSTGLKDKNGVEIYEGDVYRWRGYEVRDGKQIRPERNVVVVWDFRELAKLANIIEAHKDVEVIGNVHEHPHLLNGQ